ncbi:hypothetical protein BKA82DRAFT_4184265 [Pisolithus tinctorius]|nr:hypothetical protein BKA82DRAFT_4184265 [Pisolithus tinctorius]
MDYQPYYPPITLRKTFGKERSPSPSHSEITARKIFDFESEDTIQSPASVEKTECNRDLIPPPHGSLSRPNSGGHKGLHLVCEKYLDMNHPYHVQRPESLTAFFEVAREQFPILNRYQDSWPARDFAKMYLKNKVGTDKAKARTRNRATDND